MVDLGQFKLNGKIDRIDREADGKLTIIDYKTSARPSTAYQVDRDLQLTIYQLACQEVILKEAAAQIALYYPIPDEILYTKREARHLEALQQELLDIDLTIEERGKDPKGYPHNPGDWCEDCVYREQCPVHRILDYAGLPDASQIIEKTEEYAKLKVRARDLDTQMKVLNEEIKEYMKAQDIREIGECRLTPVQQSEYDSIKLWDLLKSLPGGYQYIKVDKKALEEDLESFSQTEQRQIKAAKIQKEPRYNLHLKQMKK